MKQKSNPYLPATARCAMLGLVATLSSATAADWTGDTSQNWNDALNWSGDVAPTGNYNINTATAGIYPILSAASSFTPVDLFIGDGAGQSGRLDQSTGTLALANTSTNGNWMFVGTNSGTGTYNLTGDGNLAVGKLWVGGFVYGENGTGTATINTTGTVTANSTDDFSGWGQYQTSVSIGWGATGNGTLNLENGTLNSPNKAIYVGSWGGTGTLNQSGGTINANGLILGRWFNTNATANITGGTLNAGFIQLAASGNGSDTLHATLSVSDGGIVNSEGDLIAAVGGSAASTGTVNIGTGGVLNIGSTTERWMIVNQWDSAQGTVNVNGGTLNLNANTDLRFSANGNTGASSVTLSSGQINGGASSVVDLNQAGGAASNNTFNLDGGTLTISQVYTNNDNGTATFNLNGGTLKASNSSANFVDLGGAGQTAVVKAGGAVIDSNGHNITVVQALLDGGTGGGLTKNGDGALTLAGTNTYTGATVVNAGTLYITGSLGASDVTVGSAATIGSGDASSSIGGDLHLAAGAKLDVTQGLLTVPTGALVSFGGFDFDDIIGFDVNSAAEGIYSLIQGDFTLDSTNLAHFGSENMLTLSGGRYAWFQQGSLDVVVIPEPGAALLGGVGVLALLRRRRVG